MALWVYGPREERALARAVLMERARAAAPVAFAVFCWLAGGVALVVGR